VWKTPRRSCNEDAVSIRLGATLVPYSSCLDAEEDGVLIFPRIVRFLPHIETCLGGLFQMKNSPERKILSVEAPGKPMFSGCIYDVKVFTTSAAETWFLFLIVLLPSEQFVIVHWL